MQGRGEGACRGGGRVHAGEGEGGFLGLCVMRRRSTYAQAGQLTDLPASIAASRMNCGTCVVFPQPVSPETTHTCEGRDSGRVGGTLGQFAIGVNRAYRLGLVWGPGLQLWQWRSGARGDPPPPPGVHT